MTLLVSWIGVDTHGASSAYIAADSRIFWDKKNIFDHGRKVFAFQQSPDILGYCGDVLFPTMALSQITEMADRGLLFSEKASSKERFEAIKEKLVQQFNQYPRMVEQITAPLLQVLHISRDPTDNLKFSCWLIEWDRERGWAGKNKPLPTTSGVLFSLGSCAREFNDNLKRYQEGQDRRTSRSVFHCFCDTLFNAKDIRCGGAPQLVGIYRKPNSSAITYGIIKDKQRYFLGFPLNKDADFTKIEWRNDLFEICDGQTMKRIEQAQSQPDPLRRK